MRTLILLALIPFPAFAADWLCGQEASQRRGSSILACGIGTGSDENEARSKAFDAAKTEFGKVCQSSDDCRGHEITVEPARTSCEMTDGKMTCHRLLTFTIGKKGDREISAKEKTERLEPFYYESIAALPKIRKGMTKAELLEAVGAPEEVTEDTYQGGTYHLTEFHYKGNLCVGKSSLHRGCYVYLSGKIVLKYSGIDPKFTEDLK
jgi:hypothetical protein